LSCVATVIERLVDCQDPMQPDGEGEHEKATVEAIERTRNNVISQLPLVGWAIPSVECRPNWNAKPMRRRRR